MFILENLFKFITGSKILQIIILAGICFAAGFSLAFIKTRSHYVAKIDAIELAQKNVIIKAANVAEVVKQVEVVKYRDRIITIKQKSQEIIAKTDKELQNENKNCTIGPAFIRLHNDAASALSGTSEGMDGSATSSTNSVITRTDSK